jgi:photosystem II stability/assembly factor-like uncharacterized protein
VAPFAQNEFPKRDDQAENRDLGNREAAVAPVERMERAPVQRLEAGQREPVPDSAPQASAARQAATLPLEIAAPGSSVRWRISGQQVERSTAPGKAWTPVTMPAPEVLTAGAAPADSVCWIVGRRGAVYLTMDGNRFERLPFPEMVDLVSVSAVDDRNGTVTSADGRSWRTSNGGLNWVPERQ